MKRSALLFVVCLLTAMIAVGIFFIIRSPDDPLVVTSGIIKNAQPLIRAIQQFEKDHGMPPKTLHELVPKYISSVPETSLLECRQFGYKRYCESDFGNVLLYDLGSRHSASASGPSIYPQGDPNNAILAVEISSTGNVLEIRTDRMPARIGNAPFVRDHWKERKSRIGMASSIQQTFFGKRRETVVASLGEPDYELPLMNTGWELRVQYHWSALDPGDLVYWPTKKYPLKAWGHATRVGDWVFIHF